MKAISMRGRILLGCIGLALAGVLTCSVRRLSAQSAGTSRPQAGSAISRAGASNLAASAQPSAAAEESLSLEIKLGDREFSGDKALIPADVFYVVFANASDQPLEIWNPDEEFGWRQLSFELLDLQSGRKYVVARTPLRRPQGQSVVASRRKDDWGETVTIQSHDHYSYSVLLSDCQASDRDWTGLPTAEFGQRFSITARFESPSTTPKRRSLVWAGTIQSSSLNVRTLNWQPRPPHYYLNQDFPAKALSVLKAEPFWISKRDDDKRTPLHIAAALRYVEVVRWLLENGADVNGTSDTDCTPLYVAEDPEVVRLILRRKPDLRIGERGETVLQRAAEQWTRAATQDDRRKWRTIVQMYLDAGADYDIFTAIDLDDLSRVKAILAKSPQFANTFKWGSPLRKAASLGRLEICRYLIGQYHVDVNDFERGSGYPILKGALAFPEVVRLLIENGADLQKRITWQGGRTGIWIIGDEATALHYVAAHGVPATTQLLLDHGIDPFATTQELFPRRKLPQTALDVAAVFGRADNAAAIVHHRRFQNVDRTLRQRVLNRCLLSARWSPDFEPSGDRPKLVETLLESGADPNTTANGVTPLQKAAAEMRPGDNRWNAEIKKEMEVLVRHGARLDLVSAVVLGDEASVARLVKQDPGCANARSADGYPALDLATAMNDERIVKALLQGGADIEIRNRCESSGDFGGTALHTAAFRGRTSIARTLIEHGANVNATSTKHQWTPLHNAVCTGGVKIARLLLEHGAKVDARDDQGHTPLQVGSAEQPLAALKALFREFDKHAGP
jgi:ankyrin repeat protein